jgi:hypothetical protein
MCFIKKFFKITGDKSAFPIKILQTYYGIFIAFPVYFLLQHFMEFLKA